MEAVWKLFTDNCRHIWQERKMISLHRPIFIAFGLVVFIVTAAVVGVAEYFWFSGSLNSRDNEIRIKNATIESLQNTTRGTDAGAETSPYRWRLLSSKEAMQLRSGLRELEPVSVAILCNGDDCGDLARSLRDVFGGLRWKVMCCEFPFGGIDDGISVYSSDKMLGKNVAEKIEWATDGRLKVDISDTFRWDPIKFPVQVQIGAKR